MSLLGEGFGVLVNANAKRGGRRVAAQIARVLPGANVRLTRTAEEVDRWLRGLGSPRAVLPAGGDGTVVALINAFARVFQDRPFPRIGILPLGTGNAWAHVVGAPKLDKALRLIVAASDPLPVRRFGMIQCEGTLTPFAGAGWDAEVLNDYRMQVSLSKGPSKWLTKSVYGYLIAAVLHTAPKAIVNGRPQVIIENLGDEVYTITADRKLIKLHGVGRGSVLYDGMASSAGCAVSPEPRVRRARLPVRRALPRDDERPRLRREAHQRGDTHAADLARRAPAAWHARLVRHEGADDVLAAGPATDGRRRRRLPPDGRVRHRRPGD